MLRASRSCVAWFAWAALGAALVGCASPHMQVEFRSLPRSVDSVDPNSCHLLSRSPVVHLMSMSLRLEQDEASVRADQELVKVAVFNQSRGAALASFDIEPNGNAQEVTLAGPAEVGDVIAVSGSFAFQGERYEFSQTCRVD